MGQGGDDTSHCGNGFSLDNNLRLAAKHNDPEPQILDYPTGYKYFDEVTGKKEFPLSGYFTSEPRNTIGRDFAGRSVAVGNRSMFTHIIPGADISIEGFARNLYNQGTMAVIRRHDK